MSKFLDNDTIEDAARMLAALRDIRGYDGIHLRRELDESPNGGRANMLLRKAFDCIEEADALLSEED
jgi:hypothetical protein